jgi:hypothetical protein
MLGSPAGGVGRRSEHRKRRRKCSPSRRPALAVSQLCANSGPLARSFTLLEAVPQ